MPRLGRVGGERRHLHAMYKINYYSFSWAAAPAAAAAVHFLAKIYSPNVYSPYSGITCPAHTHTYAQLARHRTQTQPTHSTAQPPRPAARLRLIMSNDVGDVAGKVRSLTAVGCPAPTPAPTPAQSAVASTVLLLLALVMAALHYYNCRQL